MSTSRKKQNSNITRIVGILLLEAIGAIALLNLAAVARQERTQNEPTATPIPTVVAPTAVLTNSPARDVYPYPQPRDWSTGKSLPKVAVGRYNDGW